MRLAVLVILLSACGETSFPLPDASARVDASLPAEPDAGPIDASLPLPDAALPRPDAAPIDAGVPDATPRPDANPNALSGQGLYSDFDSRTIAPGFREFKPTYALWSDAAVKRRWIWLPPGTQIDTTDMDHWKFPVGTRFFKEFALNGRPLETRMIERTGALTYKFRAYLWRDDLSDADAITDGASDVGGTQHDVPSLEQCLACHGGEAGRILGFQAIQLSGKDGPGLLTDLADEGLLTAPPPAGTEYPIPGDHTTAEALGWLHANCGHCHNDKSAVYVVVNQLLRVSTKAHTFEETGTYLTTVGVGTQVYQTLPYRVLPGAPEQSAVYVRTTLRGEGSGQMPPLATEIPDENGTAAVKAWIENLAP